MEIEYPLRYDNGELLTPDADEYGPYGAFGCAGMVSKGANMNKGDLVSIRETANGFIVEGLGIREIGMYSSNKELYVFNQLDDMFDWFRGHFGRDEVMNE